MLPTYSFLFDNVEDPCDLLEDNASLIPLATKIGCHVHPHNYFMLHINSDLDYIGEFICIKERRLIPPCQIAECSHNTRTPSLAECPPTTGLPSQDDTEPPPHRGHRAKLSVSPILGHRTTSYSKREHPSLPIKSLSAPQILGHHAKLNALPLLGYRVKIILSAPPHRGHRAKLSVSPLPGHRAI